MIVRAPDGYGARIGSDDPGLMLPMGRRAAALEKRRWQLRGKVGWVSADPLKSTLSIEADIAGGLATTQCRRMIRLPVGCPTCNCEAANSLTPIRLRCAPTLLIPRNLRPPQQESRQTERPNRGTQSLPASHRRRWQ